MGQSLHYLNTFVFSIVISLLFSCEEKKEQNPKVDQKPLFELLSFERTGLTFANKIHESAAMNVLFYEYYHNGAGVGVGDFDNDGLKDLYFVGNFGKNILYRNTGNLTFEDISDSANAHGSFGWSTGVSIIDINNDGLLDIYLCKSGNFEINDRRNELLINLGNLKFENQAKAYGLDDPGYSNQAVFFDFDRDGDLDVFILNHPVNPSNNQDFKLLRNTKDYYGSDHLYENRNGKYVDISESCGLKNNSIGFGLSVSIFDFNNDLFPDIYVANDYLEHDYLYLNNGNGTFSEISNKAFKHTSNFSMGSDIADVNNDGFMDLFVADMAPEDNYRSKTNMSGMAPEKFWKAVNNGFQYQYMINTLQLNNGNSTFSEIAQLAGIDKTDWSWASLFADFDNDGHKDLYITNGLRKDIRNNDFVKIKKQVLEQFPMLNDMERMVAMKNLLDTIPQQKISNYIYKNNGDLTFSKMTSIWGLDYPSFSNGAAYADLDNDGDIDLVVNNIDDPAFLFENKSENTNYLKINLSGPPNNVLGIGSKLKINSNGQWQYAEHYLARGYLSSVDNSLHFGLGDHNLVNEIIVTWPDGKSEIIKNVKANQVLLIDWKNAKSDFNHEKQIHNFFTEVSLKHKLDFNHIDPVFDDFLKQILLPHKMSELGPAFSIADINNDGLDDFFIGGSKGYPGLFFIQDKNGDFKEKIFHDLNKDKDFEDVASVFFDFDNDGDLDLYVVSGSNEFGKESAMYGDRLYINEQGNFISNQNALPKIDFSGSCVKAEDFNKDGLIDLFVGGRQMPEMYPSPVNSMILVNKGQFFEQLDSEKSKALVDLGMLSDAEWFDYDLDGDPDLLVVGEWMPVTVIVQDEGKFNRKVALENSSGWWNCIQKGDVNADGRDDFILGNLGLNVKYKASINEPFQVYANDFDENGHFDIVLSSLKGQKEFPVRGRQCSSEQLPEIKTKFPTYDLFAKATVEEIYTKEELENAIHYQAQIFETCVLYHQGSEKLTLEKLPIEAQFSSVESVILEDFNTDKRMDILLVGNKEETEVETPRCDASYGMILFQNDKGTFSSTQGQFGLQIDGNVRDLGKIRIKDKKS